VVENNVLRLGQEAITNAVKHAGARHIHVRLQFDEHQFSLTVVDDGRGFDPANPPRSEGGFGLVGMHGRAQELNGQLKIRTAPEQGTEVSFSVPLAAESNSPRTG
jgi:signal transduction histidine kinase